MKTVGQSMRKVFPERRGFSLVEIMMVVMLIGILAGMSAPPMFKYIAANQMQTTSDRMVADLQYARAIAISTGQAHRFDCNTQTYRLTNLVTGQVLRQVSLQHGTELGAAKTADFFPWGMAQSTVFNLALHDMARQITLLPTGMVEVAIQ